LKIALQKGYNRTLKAAARAIDPGKVFERAWEQMILQPVDKTRLAAKYL